ncbi:DNA repair protein RecO [Candidatus Pelagibacter sp.]|nr:DNA repair protein RecO [Candidatus Pelagibacter sp.]
MQWDDEGYLISKNRYNENSIIADIFTKDHGKCSGIIFGATSLKIKNFLQIGNKLFVNSNFKIEGKIGYFKVEILKANSALYFDNKKKLLALVSAMNLLKLLTADMQANIKIFNLINDFFLLLNDTNWKKKYIFWELKLLELVGYNLNLKKIVSSEFINNEKKFFVKSNYEKKYVPNFLIEDTDEELNYSNLFNGLKLVGDFLDKNILKPNNINYPVSRLDFVKSFKK